MDVHNYIAPKCTWLTLSADNLQNSIHKQIAFRSINGNAKTKFKINTKNQFPITCFPKLRVVIQVYYC